MCMQLIMIALMSKFRAHETPAHINNMKHIISDRLNDVNENHTKLQC